MTEPDSVNRPTSSGLPGPSIRAVPEGDDRPRLICPDCGYIAYENPKIIVGSVCYWAESVLLCRRAIEPRLGYWTLPAGFLELNETADQGAIREAWEEARADIALDGVLAVYSIPRISQVQILYRARLLTAKVEAGPESAEVGLFRWGDIPWGDLAFPSVHWALAAYRETAGRALGQPGANPEAGL